MADVAQRLPTGFPTVRSYFYAWRNDGLLDDLNRRLVEIARLAEGRQAPPTAGIIDNSSSSLAVLSGNGRAGLLEADRKWVE